MRRLSFSFFALLFCCSLSASPVDAGRARKIANTVLGIRPSGNQNRALSMKTPVQNASAPAYYIFNRVEGGFVIVSGDDAVTPILAYSRTGHFENKGMPENLAAWMDGLEKSILNIRASRTPPSDETARQWRKLESGGLAPAASGEKVLETALWGQGIPYNGKCPWIDGDRAKTGCVATAGAIFMRYHKHPEKGTGAIKGYDFTSKQGNEYHMDGYELGHTYDWDNMPLSYTNGEFTDKQAEQVAQLMLDMGMMAKMKYGPKESSGSIVQMVSGMVQNMGYDASAHYLRKEIYGDQEWISIMMNEIDNGRPVLYSGSNGTKGHAFVCDGYTNDGLLHFNWGWCGESNGYFAIIDMGGYTDSILAWINLEPDHGGCPSGEPLFVSRGSTISNLLFADDKLGAGTECDITSFTTYENPYPHTNPDTVLSFEGYMAVGKFSPDGQLQRIISDDLPVLFIENESNVNTFHVKIQDTFSPGEYLLPCYSQDKVNWFPPDLCSPADTYAGRLVLFDLAELLNNTSLTYSRTKHQIKVTTPVPASFIMLGLQIETNTDCFIADSTGLGENVLIIIFPGITYTLSLIL